MTAGKKDVLRISKPYASAMRLVADEEYMQNN